MHSNFIESYINKNFTIIIPSRQIDYNLKFCISKIRLFYKKIEVIIVLDDDKNKKIFKRDKNLKILFHKNKIGNKRNFAARKTKKKYLVFVDSDTYPSDHWLNYCIKDLKKFKVVCGPNLSSNINNIEQKIVSEFRKLFFVTYDVDFKFKSRITKFVDFAPACNFVIEKNLYMRCKGMQEDINSAEENCLMQKLKQFNRKILFNGKMFLNHRERNIKTFFFQRANYGSSMIELIKKKIFINQTFLGIISCLPFLFLFFIPFSFFFNFFKFFCIIYYFSLMFFYLYSLIKIKIKNHIFLKTFVYLIVIYGSGIGLIWNMLFKNIINFYRHK